MNTSGQQFIRLSTTPGSSSMTGSVVAPMLSLLLLAIVVCALILIGGYLYVSRAANQTLAPGEQIIKISPGQSLGAWLTNLAELGVIDDKRPLAWWARIQGKANKIRAGTYKFSNGQSFDDMLNQVIAGKVHQQKIAFIEGFRSKDFIELVRTTSGLEQTLKPGSLDEVMQQLGREGIHPEGRFFPDTYLFDAGSTDVELLTRSLERMDTVLVELWEKRQPDLPLKSAEEALILASIIEKETSVAAERPLIAGVFVNRLRKGMKLQTDPTVIYGVGDTFDGNITRKHLRTDTPYNTYTRKGLPPTPIAAAGKEAIWAALNPTTTKALYFVSKGDGTHQFSSTLKEHNAAVRKYQLNRKKKT